VSRVYRIAAQYATRIDYSESVLADHRRDADKWERMSQDATDKVWALSQA